MRDNLVSVIVPVYNTGKYVAECIQSLCKQTYMNIQIILVNDGSSDHSGEVCNEYARKDSRVVVINKPNGGLSDSRNAGLDAAKGKYIGFVDSDDFVRPEMFEKLLAACEQRGIKIAACGRFDYYEDTGQRVESFTLDAPKQFGADEAVGRILTWDALDVSVCDKLFAKELFDNNRFIKGEINEDIFVTLESIKRADGLFHIGEAMYYYRHRENSITTSQFSKNFNDIVEHTKILNKYVTAHYPLKQEELYYFISAELLYVSQKFLCSQASKRNNGEFVYQNCLNEMRAAFWKVMRNHKVSKKVKLHYLLTVMHLFKTLWSLKQLCKGMKKSGAVIKALIPFMLKEAIKGRRIASRVSKELNKIHSNRTNAFLFASTPSYGNLGDHAIITAEKRLVADCGYGERIVDINFNEYSSCIRYLKKSIKRDDVILLDGGGNIGNLWLEVEERFRDVIQRFPQNMVIIFPESVHFSQDEEGTRQEMKSSSIYNSHKNLHIIARDVVTFEKMMKLYSNCNIYLTPDIVFYINNAKVEETRKGVLLCLRKDKEKQFSSELTEFMEEIKRSYYVWYKDTDTLEAILQDGREQRVRHIWKFFSTAELVITDRLHGMIFAAITGTPCIALDNSTGKIGNSYKWIQSLEYVRFVPREEYSRLKEIASEMLKYKNSSYPEGLFKLEFEVIKNLLHSAAS